MGGAQTYVAGKARFLKENNWDVFIFCPGIKGRKSPFIKEDTCIYKYINYLAIMPNECPKFICEQTIENMREIIMPNNCDSDNDHLIVIESHDEHYSLWGELLAERVKGRNFCFIVNESFRGNGKRYEENMDFFNFKHVRKELLGIEKRSLGLLFEGYKSINENDSYCFSAVNDGPVQDVYNEKVNSLEKKDYNICYIGRASKSYVPMILEGVRTFAEKYHDSKIQMIFVGELGKERKNIFNILRNAPNIKIVEMGNMVPIPKDLFKKIDVEIAGAGCAWLGPQNGVLTLLADAKNQRCNGVFGIDNFNALFSDDYSKQIDFNEGLERVLIKKYIVLIMFQFLLNKNQISTIMNKSILLKLHYLNTIRHTILLQKYIIKTTYRLNLSKVLLKRISRLYM